MRIAVPAETRAHEARVAATPETVKKYIAAGSQVVVQQGAGAVVQPQLRVDRHLQPLVPTGRDLLVRAAVAVAQHALAPRVGGDVASTVGISRENADAVRAGLQASQSSSEIFQQIEQAAVAMKDAVDAVRDAADDQQMLVGIVLSRINENQSRTNSVASLAEVCVSGAMRMEHAANDLNAATKQFTV